jgi:hypothetical protein
MFGSSQGIESLREFRSQNQFLLSRSEAKESVALISTAIAEGRYKYAANIIASRDVADDLRKKAYLIKFERAAAETEDIMPYYLNQLYEHDTDFTEYEGLRFGITTCCLILASLSIETSSPSMFWTCLADERISCTEKLGDLFLSVDKSRALAIYHRCFAIDRIFSTMMSMRLYDHAIRMSLSTTANMPVVAQMNDICGLIDLIEGRPARAEFTLLALRLVPGSRPFLLARLGIPDSETSGVADGVELEGFVRSWGGYSPTIRYS